MNDFDLDDVSLGTFKTYEALTRKMALDQSRKKFSLCAREYYQPKFSIRLLRDSTLYDVKWEIHWPRYN